ncbi:hypothetical protein HYPSUDRAFT_208460 [Hypholoma sublateritium FD-334 SS-4]|uniref:Uncharacterized protein n=1 Tax=Hypholoma sublateritium (strain FD-334 SS-4) TaxID=945553 RepID=A0A0D2NDQ7_HYPSF|nr:hypothetical protein HYPSUDRAFT_208460 [Hypholoma sublateritium FD-334 SS-4]
MGVNLCLLPSCPNLALISLQAAVHMGTLKIKHVPRLRAPCRRHAPTHRDAKSSTTQMSAAHGKHVPADGVDETQDLMQGGGQAGERAADSEEDSDVRFGVFPGTGAAKGQGGHWVLREIGERSLDWCRTIRVSLSYLSLILSIFLPAAALFYLSIPMTLQDLL